MIQNIDLDVALGILYTNRMLLDNSCPARYRLGNPRLVGMREVTTFMVMGRGLLMKEYTTYNNETVQQDTATGRLVFIANGGMQLGLTPAPK
jgi:hypothetical protein